MSMRTLFLVALVVAGIQLVLGEILDVESCSALFDGNYLLKTDENFLEGARASNVSVEFWMRTVSSKSLLTKRWFGVLLEVPFVTADDSHLSFILMYDYANRRIIVNTWIMTLKGTEFVSLASLPYTVIPEIWTHVVFVPRFGVLALNGLRVRFQSGFLGITSRSVQPPASLVIGASFVGNIDDIRIWSGIMRPPQAQRNIQQNPCLNDPSLLASFPFDECSGPVATDTVTGKSARAYPMDMPPGELLTRDITWDTTSIAEPSDCAKSSDYESSDYESSDYESSDSGSSALVILWFLAVCICVLGFGIGCVRLIRVICTRSDLHEDGYTPLNVSDIPTPAQYPRIAASQVENFPQDQTLPRPMYYPPIFVNGNGEQVAVHPYFLPYMQHPFVMHNPWEATQSGDQ